MYKIYKHLALNENDINILPNTGGGNCFYKSISQFYNFVEDDHIYYRKEIASFIDSIKTTEIIENPYIYKNEYDILTWEEYFNELKLTGNYAGEYEINKIS